MNEYLYDVVNVKELDKKVNKSNYPKHLLGESASEAQKTFEDFKGMINNMVRSYSKVTGIQREELFNECIIALAKAKKDFDSSKNCSLKTYAKYSLVDAMCNYIRKNISHVSIPSYINKSHRLINRIKILTGNREDWLDYILSMKTKDDELSGCVKSLNSMANRCGISCEELVNRSEFLPINSNDCDVENSASDEDNVTLKMLVRDIISKLSDEERIVSEMIMMDMNYTEIAKSLGKTDSYVRGKLNSIRDKTTKIIKEERHEHKH
jgi:RNA polymerase sigma factor (sigma-70 family)